MTELIYLARFLIALARVILEKQRLPDDELFLNTAYHVFLKREPDHDGQIHFLQGLKQKSLPRWRLIRTIIKSDEFKQFRDLSIHPLHALHRARIMLIQNCLPRAQKIVDIGGAAIGHEEGALLLLGYPYRPCEIVIVDLPPEQRLHGGIGAEASQSVVPAEGVRIIYYYRSMSDLSMIADSDIDMVWSGESIEHVTETEADEVCRQVFRVLKPGGSFCLDTPNAALTRLQSPHALIHPEHKKEYYVHELRAKLKRWGFEIESEKGICPMPQSLRRGVFDYRELVSNIRLSENAEEGYFIYFQSVKPSMDQRTVG